MSTRATYEFLSNAAANVPAVTFYIHHDGYPEGAAAYLRAALCYANRRGGLAGQFVRANENAEFTGHGMDAHGDTEYHWQVRSGQEPYLKGYRRAPGGEWQGCYAGPLLDFVNFHNPERLVAWRGSYQTTDELAANIYATLEKAGHWLYGRGATGNASSIANDAWQQIKALREYAPNHPAIGQALGALDSLDATLAERSGWGSVEDWKERLRT